MAWLAVNDWPAGGHRVPGRAKLAGAAGVALFIVAGPVYNGVAETRLEEQLAESLEDAEGFDAVMTEKMGEISITAAGDAISGVRSRGLLFLGLSAVMAAAGVVAVRTMELGKSMGKSGAATRART
jgi:hypothetical protein